MEVFTYKFCKPVACLLILVLDKIRSRIQFGLVDNEGHRLQSVIPACSFEMINSFKGSLCNLSA